MPAPLRVVHLVSSLDCGGIETGLLRALPRLDRARFTPSLVCLKRTGNLEEAFRAQGIEVHHLRCHWHIPHPGSVRALAAFLRRRETAVLHAHTIEPALYAAAAGPSAGASRILAQFHNLNPAPLPLQRFLERRAARRRTATLFSSRTIQDVYATVVGPPAGAHEVVYWGTHSGRRPENPDRAALRRERGIPAAAPVILCLARLAPEKGHAVLLDAFRQVAGEFPDALLVLAGDGPAGEALRARAVSSGLAGAVRFPGFVADPGPWLALADAHALASPREGFPGAVLEAMGAGLPQVVTASGGAEEMIGSSGAALVVPPLDPAAFAQALRSLLRAPALRAAAGAAGIARAAAFTVEKLAGSLERLYGG